MLWSKRLRSKQLANYEGIDLSHAGAGRPNETLGMLDRLPCKFTVAEACQTLLDKTPFFFCWCLAKTCFLFVVHYLGSHIHAGTEVFVFAFDLSVDFDGVVGLVDGLVDGDDGGFEGGLA